MQLTSGSNIDVLAAFMTSIVHSPNLYVMIQYGASDGYTTVMAICYVLDTVWIRKVRVHNLLPARLNTLLHLLLELLLIVSIAGVGKSHDKSHDTVDYIHTVLRLRNSQHA